MFSPSDENYSEDTVERISNLLRFINVDDHSNLDLTEEGYETAKKDLDTFKDQNPTFFRDDENPLGPTKIVVPGLKEAFVQFLKEHIIKYKKRDTVTVTESHKMTEKTALSCLHLRPSVRESLEKGQKLNTEGLLATLDEEPTSVDIKPTRITRVDGNIVDICPTEAEIKIFLEVVKANIERKSLCAKAFDCVQCICCLGPTLGVSSRKCCRVSICPECDTDVPKDIPAGTVLTAAEHGCPGVYCDQLDTKVPNDIIDQVKGLCDCGPKDILKNYLCRICRVPGCGKVFKQDNLSCQGGNPETDTKDLCDECEIKQMQLDVDDTKCCKCPECGAVYMRPDGCDFMQCTRGKCQDYPDGCNAKFCFGCEFNFNDLGMYDEDNSYADKAEEIWWKCRDPCTCDNVKGFIDQENADPYYQQD